MDVKLNEKEKEKESRWYVRHVNMCEFQGKIIFIEKVRGKEGS